MTTDLELLGDLDPDDPRQESQQIANQLRAAILTRKFAPGDRLPSQPELSARYGVARETIKRALEILRAERLVISRQGSGTFVRAQTQRAVELRPYIEAALESPNATIDFAGFSGETLSGALTEALDKVRAGRLTPQAIAIRLLTSDTSSPLALPARATTKRDDPDVRERADRITRRSIGTIIDQVAELVDLGLVPTGSVEVRVHSASPQFKLYLINGKDAFFGFYPAVERSVTIQGVPTDIYDLLGKDVPLFHYAADDNDGDHGEQFITAARSWFDSIWATIGRDYTP